MRMQITQSEIEQAITDYVAARIGITGKVEHISINRTRKPEGYNADIEITPVMASPSPVTGDGRVRADLVQVDQSAVTAPAAEAKPAPEKAPASKKAVLEEVPVADTETEKAEEPPFVPDADEEATDVPASKKSLFA